MSPEFGLVVNEAKIVTSTARGVADWWLTTRSQFEMSGQVRVVVDGFPAPISKLGPWSREDAQFARDHMVQQGIPRTAMKVSRWGEPGEAV